MPQFVTTASSDGLIAASIAGVRVSVSTMLCRFAIRLGGNSGGQE
jgi:hypothetical protein